MHYLLHTVFCLHGNAIGSEQHLIITENGESGRWEADVPNDMLVFTGAYKRLRCLDTVIRLSAGSASFEVPERFIAAASTIFRSDVKPLWRYVLPRNVFQNAVRHLISGVVDSYSQVAARYYTTTWAQVGQFLDGLQPFTLVGDPAEHRVTYDRLRTRTGRMVIASGPPIVTMPREQRSRLRSATGMRLKYVDFRALEPTIAANIVGARFEGSDLYAWLAQRVLNGRDRMAAKLAVVQALYGGAHGRTAEAQRIASWFCVHELAQRIRRDANGSIVTNVYGRSVASETFDDDGCVINDYVQSTAVDAAVLGFEAICREHGASPVAIIHDAVIVDDVCGKLVDGYIGNVMVNGVGLLYYKVTNV